MEEVRPKQSDIDNLFLTASEKNIIIEALMAMIQVERMSRTQLPSSGEYAMRNIEERKRIIEKIKTL